MTTRTTTSWHRRSNRIQAQENGHIYFLAWWWRNIIKIDPFSRGGDDATHHRAITIEPHHSTPTIALKVNTFRLLSSFSPHLSGILLESNAYLMPRSLPMIMMPKRATKDGQEAKPPKQEAWKKRQKRLGKPAPKPVRDPLSEWTRRTSANSDKSQSKPAPRGNTLLYTSSTKSGETSATDWIRCQVRRRRLDRQFRLSAHNFGFDALEYSTAYPFAPSTIIAPCGSDLGRWWMNFELSWLRLHFPIGGTSLGSRSRPRLYKALSVWALFLSHDLYCIDLSLWVSIDCNLFTSSGSGSIFPSWIST